MTKFKRRRWTLAFLRELMMTGDSRLAAERAGVGHSEVWVRRMAEPHFAGYWDAALRLREEMGATLAPSPRSARHEPVSRPLPPKGRRSQ